MQQKQKTGGVAVKYNDDGEPQGTAGAPILKILLEKGLSNVLVTVTRYFGGTLLGTGGLVRAYSEATIKALEEVEYIDKILGYKVKFLINYDELDNLKYHEKNGKFKIINIEYLDNLEIIVEIKKENLDEFTNINNKKTIKILKYDILEEKFIDIQPFLEIIRKNFQKSIAKIFKTYYNSKCKIFTNLFFWGVLT